ncbi:MAG: peptidase C14 [Nitrospira sp.]|nr:peptidase C14 [Nitrospira sp.]
MKPRIGIVPGLVLLAGLSAGCSAFDFLDYPLFAPPLWKAAEQGDLQAVRALVDQGVPINDQYGYANAIAKPPTALGIAAYYGHVEVVRFLLDRDAGTERDRHNALFWSATNGQAPVVQLLLDRGILCCPEGYDIIQNARRHGHLRIVRMLEQAQAQQLATMAPPPAAVPVPVPVPPAAAAGVSANDVDTPPARRVKPKPNAYAVVIGIEQYRQNLPKADFAARDAQTTRDYLTKVMGYQDENVAILLNDRATKGDVEKYIEHWLPNRVEKTGTVFVYFSGHGAPNAKTGDAYLVPYDGDPAFVEATGYSLKRLYDHLGKLPAKEVVVMLDSCFSGAGGRSVIGKGMRPMVLTMENQFLAGGKTVVLAASSGAQVSSTYDQKGHGLLTYYFLKGLQGEADTNKDGMIDLAELFGYVKPQVERTARRDFNNDQQPQLFGNPELLTKGIRLVERAP